MAELELIWAVIVTIVLGILVILILKLQAKHNRDMSEVPNLIAKERKKAMDSSRNSLKGRIGEQMSPLLPEFYSKYEPGDARFLGTPIDYVIFKNMSKFTKENKVPIDVVLVEVKIGASNPNLTPLEKAIDEAVKAGRVEFDVIRPKIE